MWAARSGRSASALSGLAVPGQGNTARRSSFEFWHFLLPGLVGPCGSAPRVEGVPLSSSRVTLFFSIGCRNALLYRSLLLRPSLRNRGRRSRRKRRWDSHPSIIDPASLPCPPCPALLLRSTIPPPSRARSPAVRPSRKGAWLSKRRRLSECVCGVGVGVGVAQGGEQEEAQRGR